MGLSLVPEPWSSKSFAEEAWSKSVLNEERLEQGTSVHQENGNDQNEND